ncbi:MAG: ribosome biogenesis GTP-binding protein YihA/YsxC [Hyphomicrobiaceae bacterium]
MSDEDHSVNLESKVAADRVFARGWSFVVGAASLNGLPLADRPEVAFAGRSNVGKSSLINALTNRRNIARTSNSPGRTQELNYFTIADGSFYFVDMPGYGYARAPKDKIDAWNILIKDYLAGRVTLRRVYLLIDARRGLKDIDAPLMDFLDVSAVPYQIVLTKIDKLKYGELDHARKSVDTTIATRAAAHPIILATSAQKQTGISTLRASILSTVAA